MKEIILELWKFKIVRIAFYIIVFSCVIGLGIIIYVYFYVIKFPINYEKNKKDFDEIVTYIQQNKIDGIVERGKEIDCKNVFKCDCSQIECKNKIDQINEFMDNYGIDILTSNFDNGSVRFDRQSLGYPIGTLEYFQKGFNYSDDEIPLYIRGCGGTFIEKQYNNNWILTRPKERKSFYLGHYKTVECNQKYDYQNLLE